MNSFLKDDLLDMGEIFGYPMDYRMKKVQMLDSLTSFILGKASEWLPRMLESDLFLLLDLIEAGPEVKVGRPYPDYPSVLEAFGILQYRDSGDGMVRESWLDKDIYSAVKPFVREAIALGEDSGKFDVEAVAMGWLNLYGIMPYDFFVRRMVDYISDCFDSSEVISVTDLLAQSPLLRLCRVRAEDGTEMLASPCLYDPESLMKFRKQFPQISDYKEFTYDQASEAGSDSPDFQFASDSPEGKALSEFILSLGYYKDEIPVLLHDVFMVSQRLEGEGSLLSLLKGVLEDSVGFEDEALFDTAMNLLVEYANILPKWALSGYSSKETGLLQVVYEGLEESGPDSYPGDGYPHWRMPLPSKSAGYSDIGANLYPDSLKALLPKGFPFGMAIPHVAKDDPCPCGSGLKFGLCHGKHLS
jgi:hypothetical protein